MTYPMPEKVPMYPSRGLAIFTAQNVAVFDHATDYTEDPREGEERPPHGQIYAYYRVGDEARLRRVPISVRQAKFAPSQLPAIIATLLIKT